MPISAVWFGPVLMVAVAGAVIAAAMRGSLHWRIAAAAAGAAVALAPLGILPAAVLSSVFGPISAATIVLLVQCGAIAITRGEMMQPSFTFLFGVLLTGVLLYPMTAGIGDFDPYDLGFRGYGVPALMIVLVIAGWCARTRDLPCWIALAALLHVASVYGTGNLWTYLIDPLAVAMASVWVPIALVRRRRDAARREAF